MNALVKIDPQQGLTIALYERGCQLLEKCMTVDETRYWDSLADAAAAWGKIHKSERVEQLAKSLKLHAYRRLGEIAEMQEVRSGKPGRPGGPVDWLKAQGMTRREGTAACTLAGMASTAFEKIAASDKPPSPQSVHRTVTTPWQNFYSRSFVSSVHRHTAAISPAEAARLEGMRNPERELRRARHLARWFSEFADALESSSDAKSGDA